MTRNIGGIDKALRLGLGLFGNCPLYGVPGVNTCRLAQRGG